MFAIGIKKNKPELTTLDYVMVVPSLGVKWHKIPIFRVILLQTQYQRRFPSKRFYRELILGQPTILYCYIP